MIDEKKICKVCGLYYENFYPWGESEDMPSHDICDCCGIEFGYEDNNIDSIKKAREKWLANGAQWFSLDKKPENWDVKDQLRNISDKFR